MAEILRAKAIIQNKRGLHARASAKIVEASARFQSEIHVIKDGSAVNGRSIMGLMMLAASIGSEIEITTEGPTRRRLSPPCWRWWMPSSAKSKTVIF